MSHAQVLPRNPPLEQQKALLGKEWREIHLKTGLDFVESKPYRTDTHPQWDITDVHVESTWQPVHFGAVAVGGSSKHSPRNYPTMTALDMVLYVSPTKKVHSLMFLLRLESISR